MEAVFFVFRLVVMASWGWRLANHPAARERYRKFREGPQVAEFRRRVAEAQELHRSRAREFGRRVARIWRLSGRLLRRKRQPTRALVLRSQPWN